MRAKIASRAKGHALEERFLDLDLTQITLLYHQAMKEEKEENEEKFEIINAVNKVWFKHLNTLFTNLQIFTNPKLFKALEDEKKLNVYREDLNEDNFMEEWDKLMDVVPEEFIVDDYKQEKLILPEIDDDVEELIAGWVSQGKQRKVGE